MEGGIVNVFLYPVLELKSSSSRTRSKRVFGEGEREILVQGEKNDVGSSSLSLFDSIFFPNLYPWYILYQREKKVLTGLIHVLMNRFFPSLHVSFCTPNSIHYFPLFLEWWKENCSVKPAIIATWYIPPPLPIHQSRFLVFPWYHSFGTKW